MRTEHLVDQLAGDLRPVRRRTLRGDALILAALGAAELAVYLALGNVRPDMAAAVVQPAFWWKLISLGLLSMVGSAVAIVSFSPVASARRGVALLVVMASVCLAAGWGVDALQDGWPDLAVRLDWRGGLQCVYEMSVLAIPAVLGLGILMRRGAPTDLAATAVAAGIASAAWGAFVFVFSCPYDDPLYVAVWYLVGCALVALIARVTLPWLTRW